MFILCIGYVDKLVALISPCAHDSESEKRIPIKTKIKTQQQQQCGTWAVQAVWSWSWRWWWGWAVRVAAVRVRSAGGRRQRRPFTSPASVVDLAAVLFICQIHTHTHTRPPATDTDTCAYFNTRNSSSTLNWVCFVCDLKLSKLINEAWKEMKIVLRIIHKDLFTFLVISNALHNIYLPFEG